MLLKKLPGHVRSPAGLEWQIFRRLPLATLAGLAVIAFGWSWTALWPPALPPADLSAYLQRMDFVALGVLLVYFTALLTVAIGCVIVIIMKGPAYVADAYPLSDRDTPLP